MSVKYEMLKLLVRASGFKRKWSRMTTEELLEKKKKKNERVRIKDMKDKKFDMSFVEIMGFPVLKIIHKKTVNRANLYIIGTGMTSKPSNGTLKKALKMAKETGLDLYVPIYPLCTDYPITKAYQMIFETYEEMLKDYDASSISVLGFSSGGNLALGLASYINKNHPDVSMPFHILALSPGNCLKTEEEWQRLKELDEKDLLTPASYMKMALEIMRHGDDTVPDYMLWLQTGDYAGLRKVTLIYGSDETLYAFADEISDAVKKFGAECNLIVGKGMYHCYPMFPFCREAKEGHEMLIKLLKK